MLGLQRQRVVKRQVSDAGWAFHTRVQLHTHATSRQQSTLLPQYKARMRCLVSTPMSHAVGGNRGHPPNTIARRSAAQGV
jgi:hypothetical protein